VAIGDGDVCVGVACVLGDVVVALLVAGGRFPSSKLRKSLQRVMMIVLLRR
jgi:hypothetical protein